MSLLDTGTATAQLREARDFLLANRGDYDKAYRDFRWPALERFNWALDWFDVLAAEGGERRALWIVEPDGSETRRTFAELSARSNQVANWLRAQGVARGDRVIVMLGNQVELWETILAAMKLGAVIIPATPLLGPADLVDRVERGGARHVVVPHAHASKFDDVPGAYTRIAVGEPVDGWLSYADADGAADGVRARRADRGIRHVAALLHLRHDRPAEARRAHSRVLSGGAPVDDVLDRPAAGRRAPQRLLAGLGQARLEQRLRALARRGLRDAVQLRALRRAGAARPDGPLRGQHVLRAADRVADADPGGPRPLAGVAARGARRGRAAEPRGDRAGPPPLGHHGARRLRPDRDDRADRQHAGPAGQARLDGPPAAGLRRRAAGPAQRRAGGGGGDRARPLGAPARTDDRLSRLGRAQRRRHGRRLLPHGRRRAARRRGLHHLRRAHRRRVQGVGLPDLAVRARERPDRARGGRRGGRRAVAGPDAPGRPQGLRDARGRARADARDRASTSCASRAGTSRPTSASAGSSSASCRRRSRARSAASSCATTSTRARSAARTSSGRRTSRS